MRKIVLFATILWAFSMKAQTVTFIQDSVKFELFHTIGEYYSTAKVKATNISKSVVHVDGGIEIFFTVKQSSGTGKDDYYFRFYNKLKPGESHQKGVRVCDSDTEQTVGEAIVEWHTKVANGIVTGFNDYKKDKLEIRSSAMTPKVSAFLKQEGFVDVSRGYDFSKDFPDLELAFYSNGKGEELEMELKNPTKIKGGATVYFLLYDVFKNEFELKNLSISTSLGFKKLKPGQKGKSGTKSNWWAMDWIDSDKLYILPVGYMVQEKSMKPNQGQYFSQYLGKFKSEIEPCYIISNLIDVQEFNDFIKKENFENLNSCVKSGSQEATISIIKKEMYHTLAKKMVAYNYFMLKLGDQTANEYFQAKMK